MRLVVLITSKAEAGFQVAEAWREAGAPGVTIIPSYGLQSIREKVKGGGVELPLHALSSMGSALAHVIRGMDESTNHVILSVVPAARVDALIQAAQNELGDLTSPYTGLAFVINLEYTIGVYQHGGESEE